MMPRRVATTTPLLREELVALGVGRRTAVRLQNYLDIAQHTCWAIDTAEGGAKGTLFVATPDCPLGIVAQMTERCSRENDTIATLCVIHRRGRKQKEWRRRLVAEHKGMSAEKPHFTLLFFNPALPKQHIII